MTRSALGLPLLLLPLLLVVTGCRSAGPVERDGADTSGMPASVRADYDIFAQRCSKCHSLSRPLNSGIDDDEYWKSYVARMRRQPGSGISPQDEIVILRYLHYFSIEMKRQKAKTDTLAPAPPPTSPPPPPPPPIPASQTAPTPDGGT